MLRALPAHLGQSVNVIAGSHHVETSSAEDRGQEIKVLVLKRVHVDWCRVGAACALRDLDGLADEARRNDLDAMLRTTRWHDGFIGWCVRITTVLFATKSHSSMHIVQWLTFAYRQD